MKEMPTANWPQVQQRILASWGHLITRADLEGMEGDRARLYDLLRKRCCLDKSLADRELARLMES